MTGVRWIVFQTKAGLVKLLVSMGDSPGHPGGEVGSKNPGNPEQQRGESLGSDFGASGQRPLEFQILIDAKSVAEVQYIRSQAGVD